MSPTFDEEYMRSQLLKLVTWKQIAFLIFLCERLMPGFEFFSDEVGYKKNDKTLRQYLDKAAEMLMNGITKDKLSKLAGKCEDLAPYPEDYDSLYVSTALDTAMSVSLLMKMFTDNNVEHVVDAATFITDSIDLYVQEIENMEPNDPDLEEKILSHKLMQKELETQEKDIEFLLKVDNDINISRSLFKERLESQKSCLGII